MIVDHAIKHKTPVFVMGNVEELEKLWETLPKQMFTDNFYKTDQCGGDGGKHQKADG
mgnify:CR=1 FL=1